MSKPECCDFEHLDHHCRRCQFGWPTAVVRPRAPYGGVKEVLG